MATVFDFGGTAGSNGTLFVSSDANGSITAALDDGVVDVGDAVTFSGFARSTLNTSGIGEGGTGYYLGTTTIRGETAYIFGAAPVQGDNTALLALFIGNSPSFSGFDLRGVVRNVDTVTFGSDPACFAAGTLIATPAGETAVEALQPGDLILTADGRSVPVRWVGRQTVLKLFAGERARPVRVAKGALGGGLPHTDLVLTADHALILAGFAVNAGALVNGTTITRDPLGTLPDRATYYHIETAAHDAILANGAAAETFIDYVGRNAFDNHADYLALYGSEPVIAEMPLPRISARRQLPAALRARFGIASFDDVVTAEMLAMLDARAAQVAR